MDVNHLKYALKGNYNNVSEINHLMYDESNQEHIFAVSYGDSHAVVSFFETTDKWIQRIKFQVLTENDIWKRK